MNQNILKLHNIEKCFPGVKALNDISLTLSQGEVLGLLGENGAGKSTLIKILAGALEPDAGTLTIDGETFKSLNPKKAMELGVGVIYQEFNLVPSLSIAENIFLGNEHRKHGLLDKKRMNKEAHELLENLGIDINPATLVSKLSVGHQQLVEIAKTVSKKARILVLDEPTAPLSNKEVKILFALVKRLKKQGMSVIFISHILDELFEITDNITILRDGCYIDTCSTQEITRDTLISLMIGRTLIEEYPACHACSEDVVLEVTNIRNDKVRDISFKVREGEIIGFAGLVGAGRTELVRAIYGADKIESGEIAIRGKKIEINSPREAIEAGFGLIPEDRKQQGLLLSMSVKQNCTLSSLNKIKNGLLINLRLEMNLVKSFIKQFNIKTPSMEKLVKFLSGGNQQKVVLAKWMSTNAEILIFDEPTRGIDLGAKREIYDLMRTMTEQGKTIVMISSEMPELIGMSDRIYVIHNGKISGELEKENFSQDTIMRLASGEY